MGYFSNGSEGQAYAERYCARCVHGQHARDPEECCPVWFAHLMYVGQESHRDVLNLLIPEDVDGCGNQQCAMFHPTPEAPDAR